MYIASLRCFTALCYKYKSFAFISLLKMISNEFPCSCFTSLLCLALPQLFAIYFCVDSMNRNGPCPPSLSLCALQNDLSTINGL